jgi:hypothetical protein
MEGHTPTTEQAGAPRTVAYFQERFAGLGSELEEYTLAHMRTATVNRRHALADARLHLLEARQALEAADGRTGRRRRQTGKTRQAPRRRAARGAGRAH